MKLWRKASGELKDQKSLWMASLGRRTSFRNPEIEAAVIKATNHDELSMDTKNIALLFRLLRLSSAHHKPVMHAITKRMEKTKSWVVALKGLLLMHGVFACRVTFVQKIGRLPFDLSNFRDGHSRNGKTWALNKFIRSYYAFLDKKSEFLYHNTQASHYNGKSSMEHEFLVIQKLQGLLDMLLEIRPQTKAIMAHPLLVEAMDCVVVEVFDVYSQICRGISRFLVDICSIGKVEAAIALKIIKKATDQGEDLSWYFEICKGIGVMNASDCPIIERISKEDMQDLEDIINGVIVHEKQLNEDHHDNETSKEIVLRDPHQVALINENNENSKQSIMHMTIITHDWETFDEGLSEKEIETPKGNNPFEDLMLPTLPPPQDCNQCDELPDLIIL